LEEENVPLPDFDIKTNNVMNEVFVTINKIVDILKIIDPSKASDLFKNGCDMSIFPTRGIFTLTKRFVKNNL
jgi:hypothetical protein